MGCDRGTSPVRYTAPGISSTRGRPEPKDSAIWTIVSSHSPWKHTESAGVMVMISSAMIDAWDPPAITVRDGNLSLTALSVRWPRPGHGSFEGEAVDVRPVLRDRFEMLAHSAKTLEIANFHVRGRKGLSERTQEIENPHRRLVVDVVLLLDWRIRQHHPKRPPASTSRSHRFISWDASPRAGRIRAGTSEAASG